MFGPQPQCQARPGDSFGQWTVSRPGPSYIQGEDFRHIGWFSLLFFSVCEKKDISQIRTAPSTWNLAGREDTGQSHSTCEVRWKCFFVGNWWDFKIVCFHRKADNHTSQRYCLESLPAHTHTLSLSLTHTHTHTHFPPDYPKTYTLQTHIYTEQASCYQFGKEGREIIGMGVGGQNIECKISSRMYCTAHGI